MDSEYRILQRITGHKTKFDALFRSFDVEFKRRNRYSSVIPFNYNRVNLMIPWFELGDKEHDETKCKVIEPFSAYANMGKSDTEEKDLKKYINASWINSATKKKAFIAAQAPTVTSIPAFW